MHFRFTAFASAAVACFLACGGSQGAGVGGIGDDGGNGGGGDGAMSSSSSGGDGGSSSSSSGGKGSSSGGKDGGSSSSSSGGASSGGPIGSVSCSSPSTGYQMNFSGSCGSWRWAVKTGTDNDVGKVNLTPKETTIPMLTALPTPSVQSGYYCTRAAPTEEQTWVLRDVNIKFEHLESDGDYHLIASDSGGHTMVTEVPYPGCVGHDSCQSGTPLLCDITHARAAVDAKNPSQSFGSMGVGTIVGIGFFDTAELMNSPGPAGEAPNGVELHPILAICFGQGCNPLQGY